jgi:hypothetical protein
MQHVGFHDSGHRQEADAPAAVTGNAYLNFTFRLYLCSAGATPRTVPLGNGRWISTTGDEGVPDDPTDDVRQITRTD